MEKFIFALIVFCATICLAYSGEFKCYKCGNVESEITEYSRVQCEKDQKETSCGNSTEQACFRVWGKNLDDKEIEVRGCTLKSVCEASKKKCSDDAMKKKENITECYGTCCESDLCNNSEFTVSTNMLMMMLGLLCSAMLF